MRKTDSSAIFSLSWIFFQDALFVSNEFGEHALLNKSFVEKHYRLANFSWYSNLPYDRLNWGTSSFADELDSYK